MRPGRCLAIVLLCIGSAGAQTGSWSNIGLKGSRVTALLGNPSTLGAVTPVLFAGTDDGEVFVRRDR